MLMFLLWYLSNTLSVCTHFSIYMILSFVGDAPGPVRLLNVTESGYTHVSLSWLPPSKDNGFPATTYYCVCKYPHFDSVLQIHNTNDTHYLMSDLKEGTEYCFQVSAANTWDKGKLNQIIVSTKQSTGKVVVYYSFISLKKA